VQPRRYLFAIGYVAASMAVSEVIYQLLDTTRLSMVFMAGVLLTAVTQGVGPAMLASALAFLSYNFYLVEPRFTLSFEVEDFEVLATFLVVALMTGGLAGRLRDESRRSVQRARTLEALFEASRRMSATESERDLRRELARVIAEAIGGEAWVLAPDGSDGIRAPETEPALSVRMGALAAQAERNRPDTAVDADLRARSVAADGQSLGVAVWRDTTADEAGAADRDRLVRVLLDLGAAAIARARLGAEKAQVEAIARAEQLRTALLSSISHDFRTPLAAILASSSTLLEFDDKLGADQRRDLAQTVQEEAERLNRFVANLLDMTRLESGALELQCVPVPALEVAMRAAERVGRSKKGPRIAPVAGGADVLVAADPLLLEHILTNLMENAAAFGPAGSAIELGVWRRGGDVEIEVADHGPGVAPAERSRIFEQFYRTAQARQAAQGTGLGLSIAKGLVEAMGGQIRARARPDGQSGLSVVITLPSSR